MESVTCSKCVSVIHVASQRDTGSCERMSESGNMGTCTEHSERLQRVHLYCEVCELFKRLAINVKVIKNPPSLPHTLPLLSLSCRHHLTFLACTHLDNTWITYRHSVLNWSPPVMYTSCSQNYTFIMSHSHSISSVTGAPFTFQSYLLMLIN